MIGPTTSKWQILTEANPTTAQLKSLYKKAMKVQPFWADQYARTFVGNPNSNVGWHQLQGWERRDFARELALVISGKGSYGGLKFSDRSYRGELGPQESLTERDSDLRDLERRAKAGDPEAVKKHRVAMNRSGKAPSGEVFFKDQAKKASKELRQAAKYLRAAAKDLDGEAWNGADYRRDKFRAQAKAAGSAASRIDRSKKFPKRSHSPRSTAQRTSSKPRTSDWRDQALAASDAVQTATSVLRDIAFTYEQEDRSAAERIFDPTRWLVYLGDSISGTRDPHGGHYQNDKWKRPIPM